MNNSSPFRRAFTKKTNTKINKYKKPPKKKVNLKSWFFCPQKLSPFKREPLSTSHPLYTSKSQSPGNFEPQTFPLRLLKQKDPKIKK